MIQQPQQESINGCCGHEQRPRNPFTGWVPPLQTYAVRPEVVCDRAPSLSITMCDTCIHTHSLQQPIAGGYIPWEGSVFLAGATHALSWKLRVTTAVMVGHICHGCRRHENTASVCWHLASTEDHRSFAGQASGWLTPRWLTRQQGLAPGRQPCNFESTYKHKYCMA
jgi:hypothetical protein